MKRLFISSIAAALLSSLLTGCAKDSITKTYTMFTPVYKDAKEALGDIGSDAPQAIRVPGKLYWQGNYIFLNEVNKGVHVIDNSDPANPHTIAFINIPGNVDIAGKGNILYADMYSRLVAIDISDPTRVRLTQTVLGLFPEAYYSGGVSTGPERVIVGWTKKDTTVRVSADDPDVSQCGNCGVVMTDPRFYTLAASSSSSSGAPGLTGSTSRFAIVNSYLYAVDHHFLRTVAVTDPENPVFQSENFAGYDIETIYPFGNKLFLGSMEGLFIYDISNPLKPVSLGTFTHGRACDPVVASGSYAYVTLRSGSSCGGSANELDVLDVKDLQNPSLVGSYVLSNPYGLAKDGDILFICDGTDGLKVYNAADPSNLTLLQHISGIDAREVVAWQEQLLVVAADGIYEYNYSNPQAVRLTGKITVNPQQD